MYVSSEKTEKLPQHLEACHKDEEAVIQYLQYRDKEKKTLMLTNMRNTGNHVHNVDVLGKKKGTLIVCHGHLEKIPETLKIMCLVQNVLGISSGLFCISMIVQSVLSCPERRESKR